jgi:hypothetical protein
MTRSGELPPVPRAVLGGALEPVLSATKPRNGYFLRAESFFNIASMVDGAAPSHRTSRCTATSRCTSRFAASARLADPARVPGRARLRAE